MLGFKSEASVIEESSDALFCQLSRSTCSIRVWYNVTLVGSQSSVDVVTILGIVNLFRVTVKLMSCGVCYCFYV
jgi:hypothetical protein